MKFALSVLMLSLGVCSAQASDKCDSLAPTSAQSVTQDFKGMADVEIKGILSKIAGGKAEVKSEKYKSITDELQHYPKADKLYIWQRIIYLACISPNLKIDIDKLFKIYLGETRSALSPRQTGSPRPPRQTTTGDRPVQIRTDGNGNVITSISGGSGNSVVNGAAIK